MAKAKYGALPGVPVGATFANREALREAGVHMQLQSGIWPNISTGAYSVVLNGGYEDDDDNGDTITYTGQGKGLLAQQAGFGRQEGDQDWKSPGNLSLKRSSETRRPIRVIRGDKCNSRFAPTSGFRYDGLYYVNNPRRKIGKSGHKVCVFDLERLPGQEPFPGQEVAAASRSPVGFRQTPPSPSRAPAGSSVSKITHRVSDRSRGQLPAGFIPNSPIVF
ncbi:Carboxymuconolactone decarboxylase [Mycena chlorophos]|uniref:Carboxymuconolactone decarboxylase n=1 Tax=Mycena chlorophos TaxID=658473 RepID=A0A8H6TR73_MYCCL|nr:Carboxymuconolactone decarboxylase [Mycena chlorophos]